MNVNEQNTKTKKQIQAQSGSRGSREGRRKVVAARIANTMTHAL